MLTELYSTWKPCQDLSADEKKVSAAANEFYNFQRCTMGNSCFLPVTFANQRLVQFNRYPVWSDVQELQNARHITFRRHLKTFAVYKNFDYLHNSKYKDLYKLAAHWYSIT